MEITNNVSKLVKPSTPTPSKLRNYNISFFDEQMPNLNTPLVLYYSAFQNVPNDIHANIFDHLETSLSKTLTEFYPLAGRYMRHGSFIDCSDQGALYVQAIANFQLSKFLVLEWELKYKRLHDFLPCQIGEAGEIDDPMLSIKVTTFECGSVAIGMCFSHKVSDMSTICTFVDNWATRSKEIVDEQQLEKYCPIFRLSLDFPKRYLLDVGPKFPRSSIGLESKVKIFLFKGDAISKMRAKLMFTNNGSRQRPSKVQLIVALLWKALVGIDKANNTQSKVSFVQQGVNLRNKVVPTLQDNVCGNFLSVAIARIESGEGENIDLQGFFTILHDSVKKIENDYAKTLTFNHKDSEILMKPFLEFYQNITNHNVNFYSFTSWCKFSFYKADFGWGKPVWRSTGQYEAQNFVLLMDDEEGDGVEAWVHLDEKGMCQLEQDVGILVYAV